MPPGNAPGRKTGGAPCGRAESAAIRPGSRGALGLGPALGHHEPPVVAWPGAARETFGVVMGAWSWSALVEVDGVELTPGSGTVATVDEVVAECVATADKAPVATTPPARTARPMRVTRRSP